ncbi:MAG: sporulation protein YabP [Clostridiales bacterium]|nr:sporulation protein YabP [Clostridiales bacterium]
MADERKATKHIVTMDKRESILISGVLDVLSFDEEAVLAESEMGVLIIKGEGLHVNKLNLDSGEMQVDGKINCLEYEDGGAFTKAKQSFISRLFK